MCVVCLRGAVVKELLARADLPGSTPGGSVFCFFGPFLFSVQSLFFNTNFPFGLFSFILTADHALGSICTLSLSLEFYFGKGISRAQSLIYNHTGQAFDQKKPEAVKTCPSSETADFFFQC